MTSKPGRRWLVTATAVLVVLIAVWILAALQLDPAAASGNSLGLSLRSRLLADYSGENGGTVGSLSFSIVSDLLRDLGLGGGGPGNAAESLQLAMLTPVPTATAVNFAGQPPPSVTAAITPTAKSTEPTETPTAEASIAATRATSTPTPSTTPRPSSTGEAVGDTHDPQISSGSVSPSDGGAIGCSANVSVSDVRVFDQNFSSGMEFVQLKYEIEGSSAGYIYSAAASPESGGWTGPGQTWDAIYEISMTIDFSEGWAALSSGRRAIAAPLWQVTETATAVNSPTPTPSDTPPSATPNASPTSSPTPSTYTVHLYVYAMDNSGRSDFEKYATYTMTCE